MASTLMTPGVYIEEKNSFPNSAVAVETAVPVFIGYTEKAEYRGKSILHRPTRITSLAEYHEYFGAGFKTNFQLQDTKPEKAELLTGDKAYMIVPDEGHTLYLYNSIRLFFSNGGGPCYILPVGIYANNADGISIDIEDFTGGNGKPDVFGLLEKEYEPTLIVMPDIIALGEQAYGLYQKVLLHCRKLQSCFAIFDLKLQEKEETTDKVVAAFRDKIGNNALEYGAAYYPWLNTTIVSSEEVNFENLDDSIDLETLLPEAAAIEMVQNYNKLDPDKITDNQKRTYQMSLMATSPTYVRLMNIIREKLNLLPPSGAMAGIYTMVDNSRGVWKAPANVSVANVAGPSVNIDNHAQENLNVDANTGKSINVIRPFPGIGTLVWGARTLDGNSQDWRYINVRRTIIMIEQSLKLACRAYVFEPNDANTWVTIKSMMTNFLTNLWKQGALAGAAPEQAFDVQIGLGASMTPTDVLDGRILVIAKVAIVRPAEFIIITFTQQQQQS